MRTLLCLQHLANVRHLPGDVIELGVASGRTSLALSGFLHEMAPTKLLFSCDTFTGLPNEEGRLMKGDFDYGRMFEACLFHGHTRNVVVVDGRIEEQLPLRLTERRFCFAWLDLDLYEPTSFGYRWLEDRVVPGGVIGFHDYRFPLCPGIDRVVDDEIDTTKFRQLELPGNPYCCVFFERLAEADCVSSRL